MSYYFTNDPGKKPNRKIITFRFLGTEEAFVSDDGVFSKDTLDFGSRVLLETVTDLGLHGKVLDLGCGLGYIGILLKKYQPHLDLTMADVNETAAELAQENSVRYHQENRVLVSDGFEKMDDEFDFIVCNPPIRTGKQNVYRLLTDSLNHLRSEGKLFIVMRRQQGAESAVNYLNTIAAATVIRREKGYWIIRAENR